jgi:hypothetical protein
MQDPVVGQVSVHNWYAEKAGVFGRNSRFSRSRRDFASPHFLLFKRAPIGDEMGSEQLRLRMLLKEVQKKRESSGY